MMHGTMS